MNIGQLITYKQHFTVQTNPATSLDASLEVVRNQDLGHTTEEGESSHVTADPIGKILAPLCFGIGVVAGAKSSHKDLCLADLAGCRVDHGDRLAGVVNEKLLPGFVGLAHRRIQALGPPAVEFTKLAVFVAVGMSISIFESEQAQGNVLPAQLYVDLVPVGKRNNSRRRTGTFGEEEPKEIVLRIVAKRLIWAHPAAINYVPTIKRERRLLKGK